MKELRAVVAATFSKPLLVSVLSLFLCTSCGHMAAMTVQGAGTYQLTKEKKCKIWNPYAKGPSEASWSGACNAAGYASGRGIAIFEYTTDDGSKYIAQRDCVLDDQGKVAKLYGYTDNKDLNLDYTAKRGKASASDAPSAAAGGGGVCAQYTQRWKLPRSKYDCDRRLQELFFTQLYKTGNVKVIDIHAASKKEITDAIDSVMTSASMQTVKEALDCINKNDAPGSKYCQERMDWYKKVLLSPMFNGERYKFIGLYTVPYDFNVNGHLQRIPNWTANHNALDFDILHFSSYLGKNVHELPEHEYAHFIRSKTVKPIEALSITIADGLTGGSITHAPVVILYANLKCSATNPQQENVKYQGQFFHDTNTKEVNSKYTCTPDTGFQYFQNYIKEKYGMETYAKPTGPITFEATLNREIVNQELNQRGKNAKAFIGSALKQGLEDSKSPRRPLCEKIQKRCRSHCSTMPERKNFQLSYKTDQEACEQLCDDMMYDCIHENQSYKATYCKAICQHDEEQYDCRKACEKNFREEEAQR